MGMFSVNMLGIKIVPDNTNVVHITIVILFFNYTVKLEKWTNIKASARTMIFMTKFSTINEFYKTTDVPVLINTSMNVRGEPIVNTIEQVYNMIIKTDMDYNVLWNYIVKKQWLNCQFKFPTKSKQH